VIKFWPAVCLLSCALAARAQQREAFTFTRYDLAARIEPGKQFLHATGKVVLRNDSTQPQPSAVLQISSSLTWLAVRDEGKPLPLTVHVVGSDLDHTGAVSEATVMLPQPILPAGTTELEVDYEGAIARDAHRLEAAGTPAQVAAASDWDRIGADFTAVRGVGYVAWYPVAVELAKLREGNRVFELLGQWKARSAASEFRLRLCVAQPQPGTVLLANGEGETSAAPSTPARAANREACITSRFSPLGLRSPAFVAARYGNLTQPAAEVFYLPGHELAAAEYARVAAAVQSSLAAWFSSKNGRMTILDLPDRPAQSYESGARLFTPLRTIDHNWLELMLAHETAHAAFSSPRPWIDEGIAHLAQALQREQQGGRKAALAYLDQRRAALALAEPDLHPSEPKSGSPGTLDQPPVPQSGTKSDSLGARERPALDSNGKGPDGKGPNGKGPNGKGQVGVAGHSLITASDEVFYRSKALFVWWMLRDMLGDRALQQALAAYRPGDDAEPSYLQRLLAAASGRDLEWFFDDWVYRDRGLPEFSISSVYARQNLRGTYLVTVTVQNTGAASAEVPVFVRFKGGETSRRLLVRSHDTGVIRMDTPATPLECTVNDGSVPETDPTNNTVPVHVANK